MYPTSRSQIRVELDSNTSTGKPISCKPPNQVAQVKILRRPTQLTQSQSIHQQAISSLNGNGKYDNNKPNSTDNFMSYGGNCHSTTHVASGITNNTTSQQPIKWSVVVASSNRSTNNSNTNVKSNVVIDKQPSTTMTIPSNSDSQPRQQQQTIRTAPLLPHNQTPTNYNYDILPNNNFDKSTSTVAAHNRTQPHTSMALNNRMELKKKTYQERADEYAKARLRILGSAFPDDDDDGLLTNPVDEANVNRLL